MRGGLRNKKVQAFVQHVIINLIKHNVNVRLVNKRFVDNGTGGHFCGETPEFAVSMKLPFKLWMGIFVHEYGHFEQWIDKDSIWYTQKEDYVTNFFTWIEHESEKVTSDDVFGTQMLELDCEKRAVQLIKDFDLPLDLNLYIRASNTYIFSYNVMREIRKWPCRAPYSKALMNLVPSYHLEDDEYKHISPKFTKIMIETCF